MKETKYYCDDCEEQISQEYRETLICDLVVKVTKLNQYFGEKTTKEFHLCRNCAPDSVMKKGERVEIMFNEKNERVLSASFSAVSPTKRYTIGELQYEHALLRFCRQMVRRYNQ